MTATLNLPAGVTVRMHLRPGTTEPYMLVLAARGGAPSPETVLGEPGVNALLTHDAGTAWPDRRGEILMVAALDEGGNVLLAFRTMADALACKRRLDRMLAR